MSSAARQCNEKLASALRPLRAAVIYHVWPHYRQPVMRAMDQSSDISYEFYGSGEALEGVPHAEISAVNCFKIAPFFRFKNVLWQTSALRVASCERYDAIIFLADPNFVSTWLAAACARLRGIPVVFWGHGWLRPEGALKHAIRALFFSLSNHVLTYGQRGKGLGIAAGHAAHKITVVYNSLDVERADGIVAAIESGGLNTVDPRAFFSNPERPLLICTARLTAKCRFDILILAAALLEKGGVPVNLLLVGDGDERKALISQAEKAGVALHIFGSCYDEVIVGQLLYRADLTVSPGKIGLTAMHSLMYGTPAITHDDLDEQMPEVEAIEAGFTGAFFRRNDVEDLAAVIACWLKMSPPREKVRVAARKAVHDRWSPQVQAAIIERTIRSIVPHA